MADKMVWKRSRCVVVVGASAGGPKAVLTLLRELPESTCAVLVIQHLSHGFSGKFAEYLNPQCRMKVKEAENGEAVCDGTIYVAPDGCQMTLSFERGSYVLRCAPGQRYGGFCPSISYTMNSVAETARKNAMGVILTGMGEDGSEGLLNMRKKGAHTIAQDRETSEFYSMPESALRKGGAERQMSLKQIADEIVRFTMNRNIKPGGRQ